MKARVAGFLAVVVFLLAGLASSAEALSFASKVDYGTGTGPYSVAVGDFNGDGKPDLVTANVNNNNVSILLGNGNGTFYAATPATVAVGANPYSVAVGDFNGDGKLDLATANYGDGINPSNISILLGNGDGTFQAKVDYGVGIGPMSVAVGDFNGDGKQDLAVANVVSNTVSILLGNGDGTFYAATPATVAAGTSPYSVAVGDFDGDGELDLAVVNEGSDNVSILLGNGDGTFQAKVDYGVGNYPRFVALGDFNGDGKLDLAVANGSSNNVSILLGNGNGTFQAKVDYGVGTAPFSVVVGDFDGDGKLDLAVANQGGSNVSILLGNGNGTFQAKVDYGVGTSPYSVAAGDFNRDGKSDLATANYSDNKVSILLNTTVFSPAGAFAKAVNYGAGHSPVFVISGDFNGDGILDLAVVNYNGSNISIFLGNGDGTFAAGVNYTTGNHPSSIISGDFNGDGYLDLATANYSSNNISILLGNGDGTFQTKVDYGAGTGAYFIVAGDFNRDGKLDLAAVNYGSNNVSILMGIGDGTFAAAVNYSTGTGPLGLAVGDFNRDGKLDLATVNYDVNNISILLGNGNGTFAAAVNYSTGTKPLSLAVGDFNRDGKPDLATANSGSGGGGVFILLGVGDGTFAAAVNYKAGNDPQAVISGDFNRDGIPDLAVANWNSSYISILPGVGDGTFPTRMDYATGISPSFLVAGDFNGDGKLDLATSNFNVDSISILLNTNFAFPNFILSDFQINAGDSITANPTVTLTYNYTGSPTHIRTSTGIADPVTGAFWSAWRLIPAPGTHTFNLGATNGTREVFAQLKDGSGNMSSVARSSILLDNTAPAGNVKINGGAATVMNTGGITTVHLHLAMFDRTMGGAQMRIKMGGGGFAGDPDVTAPWVPFDTSTTKILTGTGLKTIYVQFKDGVGKKSPVYAPQITVSNSGAVWPGDSTVVVSGVNLNSWRTYTTNPAMTLQYDMDNINVQARYCFINSAGTLAWTAWGTPSYTGSGPYTCTWNLTFAGGNIPRQVYVQLRETAGGPVGVGAMTSPARASIMLDVNAPSGTVRINNGAATVTRTGNTTMVALTLPSNDNATGIDRMAIYQGTAPTAPANGDFIGFTPTVVYPLDTSTIGTKNVHVWFKDLAGNISSKKSTSIKVLGP